VAQEVLITGRDLIRRILECQDIDRPITVLNADRLTIQHFDNPESIVDLIEASSLVILFGRNDPDWERLGRLGNSGGLKGRGDRDGDGELVDGSAQGH
jgi:hypothetical protein